MAETIYHRMSQTATSFMHALLPKTHGATDFQPEAILSLLDPSFTLDWGHSLFISTMPKLQDGKSGEDFVAHMNGNAQALRTWAIDITDLSIDAEKRSAVVRADFHMHPKVGDEVLNDIVFWMKMDDTGRKLVKCTEFLDPVAVKELGDKMKAALPE